MKTQKALAIILVTNLVAATNLMAATGLSEDGSTALICMFLFMCALIVIVQLLPSVFLTVGIVKAFFKDEEEETQIEAHAVGKD